jgi:Tfp pilus assembly protein PilX
MNPLLPVHVDARRRAPAAAQRGVVLFIALLVMVALSLAGIALIRSADTATIVAGNLAFKQAAASAVDRSFEKAIDDLFNPVASPALPSPVIADKKADSKPRNYFANVRLAADGSIPEIPDELRSAKAFADAGLNKDLVPEDAAGNKSYYVIERMCRDHEVATNVNCNLSPLSTAYGADAGTQHYEGLVRPGDAFYRVTVRVEGPRNTVAYAQAILR